MVVARPRGALDDPGPRAAGSGAEVRVVSM